MTVEWWTTPSDTVLRELSSSVAGLTSDEAALRLERSGPNEVASSDRTSALRLAWSQLANPLVLILVFAAIVSTLAREWTDAVVVVVIVLASAAVSFWREFTASRIVDALKRRVSAKVRVLRDGVEAKVFSREVVPGDVLLLSAGSLVAADGLVLEARDFFVSEAVLTGETFPVEKRPGALPAPAGCIRPWPSPRR